MIYALRKLVEAEFTLSAINTQLNALNTLYSLSVPSVVTVTDGAQVVVGAQLAAWFPAVLHYVATQPSNGEAKSFGKRDIPDWPLIIAVHSRQQDLAIARRDCEVILEALHPIYEALVGKQFGSTLRQILNVGDWSQSIEVLETKDGAVTRLCGVHRGSIYGRTQGA